MLVLRLFLEYLPSDVYQAHPPKLVLWELPSHYLLKDKSLLRQLIPLVNNGCQNKTLLMSKKIKVSPAAASNEMVFSKELLSYQSKKLVMDMKVSDPNVHQMHSTNSTRMPTSIPMRVLVPGLCFPSSSPLQQPIVTGKQWV